MATRQVKKVPGGATQYDGAGVKLVRVIGNADVQDFDPFLMLDAFDSYDPKDYVKGFPWHPHRGIETVTYLISGDIEHGDSLGNSGSINDGCCQWMTAGSGIIHQEMPKASPRMLGTQLWINLPQKNKMSSPAYRDIREHMIPIVEDGETKVRVISGEYQGTFGPEQGDFVRTLYLDVQLEKHARWSLTVEEKNTVFCYLVEGSASFGGNNVELPSHRAVLLGEGDVVEVQAGAHGVRLFLLSGKPLHEPIAWGGPIVMNTREELRKAFAELDAGTFIKS